MMKLMNSIWLSLRSRRKHRAWGVSPRKNNQKGRRTRETGDRAAHCTHRCRPFHGLVDRFHIFLGLTPQALCLRLLRRRNRNLS